VDQPAYLMHRGDALAAYGTWPTNQTPDPGPASAPDELTGSPT